MTRYEGPQCPVLQDDVVLTAYLDESYSDERYYVAAFIIGDTDLPALEAARLRMAAFVEGFGIAPGTELHAHSLMTGRDGFEPIAHQPRARIRVYQQWMNEIATLPARLVVRGVDIPRLRARFKDPRSPHQVTLRLTLEAVDDYALEHDEQVRIVADALPDHLAHAEDMLQYQRLGTGGPRSTMLAAIVPPLAFEDSAEVPGLQAADAIAYLFRRRDAHSETDPRVAASVDRLWATVSALVHRADRWDP